MDVEDQLKEIREYCEWLERRIDALEKGNPAGLLGARGGLVKSDVKAEAARLNGAKGGRPKGSGKKSAEN